jgi:hypothetical protein
MEIVCGLEKELSETKELLKTKEIELDLQSQKRQEEYQELEASINELKNNSSLLLEKKQEVNISL